MEHVRNYWQLYLLICAVLITTPLVQAQDLKVATEMNYAKKINGNAGQEFLIKTTIPFKGLFELKLGFSENYTAMRSSPFSMNHCGTRVDIGALWVLFGDWKVGYTHSSRKYFEGANPTDVYINDSIDTFSVRKEFNLKM